MTPNEIQLVSENAALRTAVTVQALAFVLLCLIGLGKTAFLAGLKSGDIALDLERRTVEIRLRTVSR